MIRLEDVHKAFSEPGRDPTPVLRGIDFELAAGEFATVVGVNGSGKSTLLNAVAGRFAPDKGRIVVDGQDVTRQPEHRRAAVVGRVFQNPLQGTCPGMTVAENMRLATLRGRARGLRIGLRQAELDAYIERLRAFGLGLEDRLHQLAGTLSGGQRQALSLLMATLTRPKVLLLDEHTAALDPRATEQVISLTDTIVRQERLTTLMVTHSMSQAVGYGDRTLVVHAGRIAEDYRGVQRAALSPDALAARLGELYGEHLALDPLPGTV